MQPIRVTAELIDGFLSKFEWSPSLDGILAYADLREKMGADEFLLTKNMVHIQSPHDSLPLQKEIIEGDWWYQSSRPIYSIAVQHRQYLHRRFNTLDADRWCEERVKVVETTKNGFKNYRLLFRHHITQRVVWHCVGDADRVRALLNTMTHIGAKTGSGFGRVKQWRVELNGDASLARFCRPLPIEFAQRHGIVGAVMEWAHRPPLQLVENKRVCVIPETPDDGR